MLHSPTFLLATSVAGGLTASVVAVGAGEVFGEKPSVAFFVGFAIVSALGAFALSMAKKWLENLFSKIVDAPTRGEIKEWVEGLSSQSSGHFRVLSADIKATQEEVHLLKKSYYENHAELKDRVTNIEARHRAIDSLKRRRQTDSLDG